jgi:hypothetical protein
VPEFIDPVFVKTSPKRSFSVIQNERFGLVFVKPGSIISGTVLYLSPNMSYAYDFEVTIRTYVPYIHRILYIRLEANIRGGGKIVHVVFKYLTRILL